MGVESLGVCALWFCGFAYVLVVTFVFALVLGLSLIIVFCGS